MKNTLLKNSVWSYLGLVTFLSAFPYYFIISENAVDSEWTLLLMWMPALAAILMRLITKESVFKGLGWNPLKSLHWILLAAFIPLAIEWVSIGLGVAAGAAEWNASYISAENGLVSLKGNALLFGTSDQNWAFFFFNYLLSYFVGAVLYSIAFAFGEELGWRGYLQPRITEKYGWAKGLMILGIVWGYWHMPGVLLGHNYPDYPILGALVLMPILTTAFSWVLGEAYRKSMNIWVPVVLHGAINISAEVGNVALIEETKSNMGMDFIWTSLWLIVAFIAWRVYKQRMSH